MNDERGAADADGLDLPLRLHAQEQPDRVHILRFNFNAPFGIGSFDNQPQLVNLIRRDAEGLEIGDRLV